jgi:hypothetical protein
LLPAGFKFGGKPHQPFISAKTQASAMSGLLTLRERMDSLFWNHSTCDMLYFVMEDELVIVSDSEFEWLAYHPGSALDETGKLLIRTDSGVKQTFIRQPDWEKTQEPFGFEAQAGRERIEKARRFRYGETDSVDTNTRFCATRRVRS